MNIWNTILLYVAISISSIVIYKMLYADQLKSGENSTTTEVFPISDKMYKIILLMIWIVACAVRLYKFGQIPGGCNQDGAMAAVDAKALAMYGTDRYGMYHPVHLTAWGYGQMSAMLSYLMIPFVKVFGLAPVVIRIPQLIFSTIGILFLYLFVKEAFDKNAALMVAFFAAINPWHIMQSRWALEANLFPHFFMIGFYLLNRAISFDSKSKKRVCLVLSMIFFGLSMYCYGVSIYTVPVFLVIASIYLLRKKKNTMMENELCILSYMLVAGPFILTMLINYLKLPSIETFLFTIPYFPDSLRSNDIIFFSDNIGEQLIKNLNSVLNIILLQEKDLPWNDMEAFGTMYKFSIPFALVGVIAIAKDYRKNESTFLLFTYFAAAFIGGLITKNANINRLNLIFYPVIILVGVGIYYCIKTLNLFRIKYGIIFGYIVAFGLFANSYFTTYASEIEKEFMKDFGEAVASVKELDVDKVYITSDSQFEGSRATSEILTQFYLDIDAQYYQEKVTPENMLPYSERFTFFSKGNINVDYYEDAAYVVTSAEEMLFDRELYHVSKYGEYYVFWKK